MSGSRAHGTSHPTATDGDLSRSEIWDLLLADETLGLSTGSQSGPIPGTFRNSSQNVIIRARASAPLGFRRGPRRPKPNQTQFRRDHPFIFILFGTVKSFFISQRQMKLSQKRLDRAVLRGVLRPSPWFKSRARESKLIQLQYLLRV